MADRDPHSAPPWLESLNALGRPSWISLDETELLDEARTSTGRDDFGDEAFREPLRVLLQSIETENSLHFVGRALARDEILTLLENRLGMTEERKRHPEIGAVEIRRPVFITGLPRTGTSILHELLACDPDNRVPLAWEVRRPCPPPKAATFANDPRIEQCDTALRIWSEIVPEYPAIHELGARLPVECIMITAHEFRSDQLAATNHAIGYGAWLADANLEPAYRGHRRMLQHLGWRAPGKRWVLKAPSHLGALSHLLAVYPDACIVQTHRDPLKVMGSVMSTLYATARVRAARIDTQSISAWFSGESCAALLEAASQVRDDAAAAAATFVDVAYADLVADPLAAVTRVYADAGLRLGDDAAARMRAYLVRKPKGKHGTHVYEIGETGADVTTERERFVEYQRRYRVPSET
jgi:hypothetical protein